MLAQSVYTLINQQNGNLAFKLFEFDNTSYFDHIQRHNYFNLILIISGEGTATVDLCDYSFQADNLFAFYPYQPFMLRSNKPVAGICIQFHHDFFCIYRHHQEIAANGILFNNVYQQPFICLNDWDKKSIVQLIQSIAHELKNGDFRQDEVLVSYLKILLVTATRIKLEQQSPQDAETLPIKQQFVIQRLKNAIEDNFRIKHAASDYADLLHQTTASLARIAKNHFNKTLSELIIERIIIEAKRELYLTDKTIKEIAYELGYDDEYYFSRLFKSKTDISPQSYRNTVGFNRAIAT
jgi:AraC-like DNA-binding protein